MSLCTLYLKQGQKLSGHKNVNQLGQKKIIKLLHNLKVTKVKKIYFMILAFIQIFIKIGHKRMY